MKELDIIYEDDEIILCHKPTGVATQTKRLGQQDMESLLKNYRVKKGEPPYIGIVHRLDQPVEGIMVFAKKQEAAANLSKQIQQRIIGKYYYAVSQNEPKEKTGELENYLLTDKKTNYTKVFDADKKSMMNLPKEVKQARLEYKVVETKENKTLFDIQLHTGRQHQIRVQMAHMGCPIIGDTKYGVFQTDKTGAYGKHNSLALCSYRLQFTHPTTGKKMDYRIIPYGTPFQEFFEQ